MVQPIRTAAAVVASMLLAFALLLTATGRALAQDATPMASPMASPTAGPCDAPTLPPGTPTPQEEPFEEASPEATPSIDMGTPDPAAAGAAVATEAAMEASPDAMDASPAAMATPVAGTPADQATADRVAAGLQNIVNCFNSGDYLAFAALHTQNGLMNEFGTTNPYDLPLFVQGSPSITLQSVTDVQTHPDGRLSADTVTLFGPQLQHERIFLVEQDGYLLFDEGVDLPVEAPAGATTVSVSMTDFAFSLDQDTVPAGDVVLHGINNGQYFHEIAVVKFPEGVQFSMEMMEAPEPPAGTQFLGGSAGPPGAEFDLVLVGLQPGTYTLLCFVDEPDRVPHVVKGMVTELTVQ